MSYTKLHSEILDSTIWLEPLHVKVVWITMLAMRDDRHEIQASIPNLAKRAGVTIEQCQEALQKFMAPDPHSRSQEYEGRRIEEVRGGWLLLNGDYYQKRQSESERKAYKALWIKSKRLEEKVKSLQMSTSTNVENVDVEEKRREENIYIPYNFSKNKFDINSELKNYILTNYHYIDLQNYLDSLATWIHNKYRGPEDKDWWPKMKADFEAQKPEPQKPKKVPVWNDKGKLIGVVDENTSNSNEDRL